LGDEVRVGERGDRAHSTSSPHLRASVEKVGHIPEANTVAYFETGLHAEGMFLEHADVVPGLFHGFTSLHSETLRPQTCPSIRPAKCVYCRRASWPQTRSNGRSTGGPGTSCNRDRYRPGGAFPRRSTCPSRPAPRKSRKC